ncbi:hypothetical protein PR048_000466 [Dryococelus australis]|uniref:DUF4371 domain-containing protein n=1 Tax=Dryococelus australis TaxID=614101 RepID=A0ABQ9IEU2_9NEOP|nr:hypothetical protein PR048_000466 [Dryococelus australis]
MDKFVYKKLRVEFTENLTSLPDADASSHIPSLALSASSASASSVSQTSVASCNKLPDMENAHSAIMEIFTILRFLCLQGLFIRGNEDISSNFIQLLELRKEDVADLKEWMGRASYKWLPHNIQIEIDTLGKLFLRSVREHFAIMVDDTRDISIHEQVTFCIRSVENLTISKDFVGLYVTPNTERKPLFGIIKDILARLDLNIENLQGQCYDCASAMSRKFKGLQKFVADLQPKAIYLCLELSSSRLPASPALQQMHYKLLRTVPVTTDATERSFSALRRLKT